MAEIEIKKKTPIWPWIVGILAVLAILYFMFLYGDDDVDADDVTNDVEMVTDDVSNSDYETSNPFSEMAVSAISGYQMFIAKEPEMGLEHQYTHTALNKLIDATEAVANTLSVDITAELETARENSDFVTKDTYDVDHADKINNAGNIIVQALDKIQNEKFPDLDESSTELQNSVTNIQPATQTLEQKAAVKNFFEKAGDLLTNMKNN
jgi:hypothetical protein